MFPRGERGNGLRWFVLPAFVLFSAPGSCSAPMGARCLRLPFLPPSGASAPERGLVSQVSAQRLPSSRGPPSYHQPRPSAGSPAGRRERLGAPDAALAEPPASGPPLVCAQRPREPGNRLPRSGSPGPSAGSSAGRRERLGAPDAAHAEPPASGPAECLVESSGGFAACGPRLHARARGRNGAECLSPSPDLAPPHSCALLGGIRLSLFASQGFSAPLRAVFKARAGIPAHHLP